MNSNLSHSPRMYSLASSAAASSAGRQSGALENSYHWPAVISSSSLQRQAAAGCDAPVTSAELVGILSRAVSNQSGMGSAVSASSVSSLPSEVILGPMVKKTISSKKTSADKTKGKDGAAKKRSWKKPEGKPKRPLSAYNLFFQSERERIVAERNSNASPSGGGKNEEWGDYDPSAAAARKRQRLVSASSSSSSGGVGFAGLARNISAKWKSLDEASKAPFEAMADRDKQRYQVELQRWEQTSEAKQYKADRTEAAKIRRRERTKERRLNNGNSASNKSKAFKIECADQEQPVSRVISMDMLGSRGGAQQLQLQTQPQHLLTAPVAVPSMAPQQELSLAPQASSLVAPLTSVAIGNVPLPTCFASAAAAMPSSLLALDVTPLDEMLRQGPNAFAAPAAAKASPERSGSPLEQGISGALRKDGILGGICDGGASVTSCSPQHSGQQETDDKELLEDFLSIFDSTTLP